MIEAKIWRRLHLGRNAWKWQCREFLKCWKKMSDGGNRRPSPANTPPAVYPKARRKDGGSWVRYTGNVRKSTPVSSSKCARRTTQRIARRASKQSMDSTRYKCQRRQQHHHGRGPANCAQIHGE